MLAHLLTGLRADQAAAEGASRQQQQQQQQNRALWVLLKSNSDPHAHIDVKLNRKSLSKCEKTLDELN